MRRWPQLDRALSRALAMGLSPEAAVGVLRRVSEAAPDGAPTGQHLRRLAEGLEAGVALPEALARAGAPVDLQAAVVGAPDLGAEAEARLMATARRRARRLDLLNALLLPLGTMLFAASVAAGFARGGGLGEAGGQGDALRGMARFAGLVAAFTVMALGVSLRPRWARRLPGLGEWAGLEQAAEVAGRLARLLDGGVTLNLALGLLGLGRAATAVADGVPLSVALGRTWAGPYLSAGVRAAEGLDLAEALREAHADLVAEAEARRQRDVAWLRAVALLLTAGVVAGVALEIYAAPTRALDLLPGRLW